MIVLDRLVRRNAAPAAWKATALAWSFAALAMSSLTAHAQSAASSATPTRAPAASAAASAATPGAASSVASAGGMPDHYAVQKGQSLLDVAADLTHSTDKAVKQTLANALFAANPNAFYGNNPSRMKLGAVLAVPRPGDNPASMAAATGSAAGQGAASAVRDVAPAPAPASASLAASGAQKAATTATTTPTPITVAAPTATTAPTPTTAPMPTKAPAAPTAPTVPALTTIAPQAATPGIASVPTAASSAVLIRVASESESVAPASTPTQASASATAGSNASDVSPASAQATSAAQPASVSSPAAAASTAASTAQAWAGSIRPAPAAPPASSAEPAEAASLVVTSAQNVSSLQQLLQLKNRVLAAMQAHSFSTGASNAGTASVLNAASGAASVPRAAVSASTTHTQGPLRGPLALPAALAVLIVVALGIWVCLPSRRRKPHRDADDLPPAGARSSDKAESPDSAAETDAQTPANAAASGVSTPGASSQGTAPASRTANAAKSRLNAGLERETPSALPPDDDPIFSADVRESPFGQPPFSFEEGAAGGLPTHDPQRSPFAESSRTPFDTGLLLGLLEMHAHRREVERFQETAHELWELTDGEGPDWKRAAQLGRRIDPENPLYADDPFTALRQHHETSEPGLVKPMPDVDLSLPEDPAGTGAQTTQAAAHADPASDTRHEPDARASEDAASGVPATGRRTPGADLDWLDVPSGAAHEAFQPHTPAGAHAASDETLPEARGPGHVPVADPRLADGLGAPVARAPSVADEIAQGTAGPGSVAGLGASFDLADALNAGTRTDTGRLSDDPMRGAGLPSGDASQDAPEHREDGESARPLFSGDAVRASALRDTQRAPSQPGAGQPSGSPAGFGAAGFGALKLDFDLELTPNAAAPGSTPTSHDLATIARNKLDLAIEYVELGDRSGARTLLNEVLATHDAATQERAQTLLDSLK